MNRRSAICTALGISGFSFFNLKFANVLKLLFFYKPAPDRMIFHQNQDQFYNIIIQNNLDLRVTVGTPPENYTPIFRYNFSIGRFKEIDGRFSEFASHYYNFYNFDKNKHRAYQLSNKHFAPIYVSIFFSANLSNKNKHKLLDLGKKMERYLLSTEVESLSKISSALTVDTSNYQSSNFLG